jgi:hypothetical protein
VNNEAHLVRVQAIESEAAGSREVWTLTLTAEDSGFGGGTEMTYNTGGKSYTPDDMARLRAGRILLNNPAPRSGPSRGFSSEDTILSWMEGSGRYPVKECVVCTAFGAHGTSANWKTVARLKAVFLLKAAGVVEHVLDLTLGAVRGGRVEVKFRGQRATRHGATPVVIELNDTCPLDAWAAST